MNHEIDTQWMGKMQFNTDIDGHTVIMDAPQRVGGGDQGPIPKPFVLTALSGCTGMEVVAHLRKIGQPVEGFSLKVTGEISATKPIVYTSVHVVYDFTGALENRQASLDAVTLSQEKYCGVSHMLKKIMPVTWDVVYNQELIFTNKPHADRHAA